MARRREAVLGPRRAGVSGPAAAGPGPGPAAGRSTGTGGGGPATSALAPIGAAEYAERARTAYASAQGAAGRGADVIVLFDDQYIQYFTGFVFSPTERPIALVVGPGGERVLFVPRLELEHAEALADVDRVVAYPEYPGEVHPSSCCSARCAGSGWAAAPSPSTTTATRPSWGTPR